MSRKPYDHLFKILLIGDSGVGKTCLIFRFCDDQFRQSFIATIGIDFKIKSVDINGKRIRLQIWDTAGQERFRTITISYYRNAHAILLVYDITRNDSFEGIVNWMRQVQEHAKDDVERIIVGNKLDMEEQRQVSKERGLQLALDHGLSHVETSAKTGENVEKAFLDVTMALLKNPNLAVTSRQLPSSIRVENVATNKSEQSNSLLSTYSNRCC